MANSEQLLDYDSITDTLLTTFGPVLSRDVIYTIVESCSGDLNYAANAIMLIINENDSVWTEVENIPHSTNENNCTGTEKKWPISENDSGNHSNNIEHTQHAIISSTSVVNATTNSNTLSYVQASTPKVAQHAKSNGTSVVNASNNSKTMFYAQASTSKNVTISTQKQNYNLPKKHIRNFVNNIWTEKIRKIVKCYNEGVKILIFMRGAPGSGKSHLARQIVEITVGPHAENLHIFSTDDFFMSRGIYKFNKAWLPDAHLWNQKRARQAIKEGNRLVIIDNTNVESWEMKPYAIDAVNNGYLIEIIEPDTPWAKKLSQLKIRNTHNVPERNIQRMLDMLSSPITSTSLLAELKLCYPEGLLPPDVRYMPELKDTSTSYQQNGDLSHNIEYLETSGVKEQTEHSNLEILEYNDPIQWNQNSHQPDSSNQNERVEVQSDSQEITHQIESLNINKNYFMTFETPPNNEAETEINSKEQQLENDSEVDLDCSQNHVSLRPFDHADNIDNEVSLIQNSESLCTEKKEEINLEENINEQKKLEDEWENGETWEEEDVTTTTKLNINSGAKPPRKKKIQVKENSLTSLHDHGNNWRKISMFMPPWIDNNTSQEPPKNIVETKSAETCIEIGDTEISNGRNPYKIISTVSRDINLNYIPSANEKIPENRMFDKSSMTSDPATISRANRCKNEEKHFIRFRNMFKNLNKDDLRYIFDKCYGDVNWAVSLVLDDMANKQIKCVSVDEQSDIEEENYEPCECTAHYNIIPDVNPSIASDEVNEHTPIAVPSTSSAENEILNHSKKQKKDSPLTDTSLALKRQIEENIVISDHHYSHHCLKVRKMRRGEMYEGADTVRFDVVNSDTAIVNTDTDFQVNKEPITGDVNTYYDIDDDVNLNDVEKTVNINIGHEFLSQLDSIFGREDMIYSNNIEPRINMPMSLLNEINALWMESLVNQLEAESTIHEQMIKQDEEFARELAKKEEEVRQSGKKSEEPNLKEVMDLEYALSLYHKDCKEWQKDRPTDLAAKLSTQKLHNLFPEIAQADLDEIHMAHHYDFQATVGVLLMSSGRSDMVEEENGINKFVMAEELRRQQKLLEEEKEKLKNELEWPALPSQITMDVVNNYRTEAETHLQNRQMNFGKAQDYMSRGMPLVASFYSDVAHLHTLKYEHAQSIAAASLMQFHAERCKNSETLDLHYLRVTEAKTALDMFLDSHIQNLRQNLGKKNIVLYFITGRGLHSAGGPKIKPVVKKRLLERRLPYIERNPGLLTTKVCAGDMLSYQIT